jgi:enoyl-CoA hydratase / 3-hydroxyacyl-CoA dehydrogenase
MPIEEISKVVFIGSGTMGCFNSLVTAICGYECVLFDISEEALQAAPERQKEMGQMAVENNQLLTEDLIKGGLGRISYTSNLENAVKDADLLSESVAERLELKRQVHKQLDSVCSDHTIITTNTSSLLVSDIEDVVKRGDKFAALHFHLGGSLLDIVGGPRTSPATIDILVRFARSTMQTPVVLKKEKDGYLFNTMFIQLVKTAGLLVCDGYADFTDVDRSYMAATGGNIGPFGMLDNVGLNVCLDVIKEQGKRKPGEGFNKVAELLTSYVDKGDLGKKTGIGFYTYPNPVFAGPEFLK